MPSPSYLFSLVPASVNQAKPSNLLDGSAKLARFCAGTPSLGPLMRPVSQKRRQRHLGTADEGACPPHTCCPVQRLVSRDACAGESLAHRAKFNCEGRTAPADCSIENTQAQQDAQPCQLAQCQRKANTLDGCCRHRRGTRPHLKCKSHHSMHMQKGVCTPVTGARPKHETQQQRRATPEKACVSSTGPQALEKLEAQYAAQPRPLPEVQMPKCTCERSAGTGLGQLQGLENVSVTDTFTGASVLITGATGYIGSLVRLSCDWPHSASHVFRLCHA